MRFLRLIRGTGVGREDVVEIVGCTAEDVVLENWNIEPCPCEKAAESRSD
jgi:hypothetical protein